MSQNIGMLFHFLFNFCIYIKLFHLNYKCVRVINHIEVLYKYGSRYKEVVIFESVQGLFGLTFEYI